MKALLPLLICIGGLIVPDCSAQDLSVLEERFAERRGQLQVGGPFAGLEFHHARPVPSRISFYYPVANSIDLSTDYWERHESLPLNVRISLDGDDYNLADISVAYRSTPASAVFEISAGGLTGTVSYRFAETGPYFVFHLDLKNPTREGIEVSITTSLDPTFKTSHTYATRHPASISFLDSSSVSVAEYAEKDTGGAILFVANAGSRPEPRKADADSADRTIVFEYEANVEAGRRFEVIQLVGSSTRPEFDRLIGSYVGGWSQDVARYESRILDSVERAGRFRIADSTLLSTAGWSMALLEADRHYIDGRIVPMPCPAQYNFFFTHDLLLTDLGAVNFDARRVRDDLLYLGSLTGADSLLPHAYYWKDDGFLTEFAGSDNWNHLWFILVSSSYLKHTGDVETVSRLRPILVKSIRLMLENERGGLMHAERPDWWDIGHVYGARAYTTILAIRALRSFAYVEERLGDSGAFARSHLSLADSMQTALADELWDDDAGYLLNRIEGDEVDRHYYSGSLLAAAFGYLGREKENRLLDTARDQLLDPQLGIRNAMPTDFESLVEKYRFQVGEVGAPFRYMNGGIWPQGSAWYVMGLIQAGRSDEALAALKSYLTLDGIRNSPNGQPAFYEYRNADLASPDYGSIDKTAFLWAGGFYLNALYRLLGVRENEWNLSFSPNLPSGLDDVAFDLLVYGSEARISIEGTGSYFRSVTIDGESANSAVLTGPAESVRLERGIPESPYLAGATAIVEDVTYGAATKRLDVTLAAIPGQTISLRVVSPVALSELDGGDGFRVESVQSAEDGGAFVIDVIGKALQESPTLSVHVPRIPNIE